jgi:hypothetical protein
MNANLSKKPAERKRASAQPKKRGLVAEVATTKLFENDKIIVWEQGTGKVSFRNVWLKNL